MECGAGVLCISTGTVFPNNVSAGRKTSSNPTDYFRTHTSGTACASRNGAAKEVGTSSASVINYGSCDPTAAG
jgi:hypothetical protein